MAKKQKYMGFSAVADILSDNSPKDRFISTTLTVDSTKQVTVLNRGNYDLNENIQLASIYLGGGWKNDKLSIEFNNFLSTNTYNAYATFGGESRPSRTAPNFTPITTKSKEFRQNTFNNALVQAKYQISKKQSVQLSYFNNISISDMPMYRTERYDSGGYLYVSLTRIPNPNLQRLFYFYRLDQKEKQQGAILNHHLYLGKKENIHIHTGVNFSKQSKTFESRSLGFFAVPSAAFTIPQESLHIRNEANIYAPENIGPHGFYLKDGTKNSDSYTGDNQLLAFFIQPTWSPNEQWSLTLGSRLEFFQQNMQPITIDSTAIILDTTTTAWLPNLLLKYQPNENLIFKAGYFQTINRTTFLDLHNYSYFNSTDGFSYKGNPRLTYSTLHHVEIKAEYYFSGKEMVSLAAFYKYFDKPFEQYRTPQQTSVFSFRNIQQAEVYGLELELRKSFEFISDKLNNLFFYGNFSFIRSETKDTSTGYVSRRLQGQADYINNSGLIYSIPKFNLEIGAFYNYVGKLIYYVGTNVEQLPDVWQLPRHILDFQIKKTFKNLELKLLVNDVFNQPYKRAILYGDKYDKNRDLIIYSSRLGFRTILAINYKF